MRYALLAKDTLMYIQCQEYIGDAYFLLGKEDSVVYFTQQAYETYLKYGRKDWAAATPSGYGRIAKHPFQQATIPTTERGGNRKASTDA